MKYFKNTELAKLYNVSEKSVRNWIQAAQEDKLDIDLYDKGGKSFIANVTKNTLLIEQLVEKGKKYKNSRGLKVISPTAKFYETYSTKQIFDIIKNLTINHELPLKYSYVDGGAYYWDQYARRLLEEKTPNMLTNTIELLESAFDDLDHLADPNKKINIIDLGCGNCLPVRQLLTNLINRGRLNRYIAIDISPQMLQIAEKNIREWFGGKVKFEGYARDLEYDRFDDLFAEDYAGNDADIPINLTLLLGGTLCNLRSPNQALQAINNSLGINDLFLYSTKLDTPSSRRYFDFNIAPGDHELTPRHRLALELQGIDRSVYEVEQFFDDKQAARFIQIKPKVAISIKFALANGTREVTLNKDEPVGLWRYWHQSAIDIINQFDKNDFDLMKATKSRNQEFLLLIAKIKTRY
jgi:SAM-dependent methyltransferase